MDIGNAVVIDYSQQFSFFDAIHGLRAFVVVYQYDPFRTGAEEICS